MTEQLTNTLLISTAVAEPAAGPAFRAQSLGTAGTAPLSRTAETQTFAAAMGLQLPAGPRSLKASPAATSPGTVLTGREIFAARASPAATSMRAPGATPVLATPDLAVVSEPGDSLPPAGKALPIRIRQSEDFEAPVAPPSTGTVLDLVSKPAPLPEPEAVVAGRGPEILPNDPIPIGREGKFMTDAPLVSASPSASRLDEPGPMSASTGGRSSNPDAGSHDQPDLPTESAPLKNQPKPDDPVSKIANFHIPSGATTLPASTSMSALLGPLAMNEPTELPQFQSMRPLQPTVDPDLFSSGLGNRVMMMSEKGVQSARLKLHPENLGPLDVRIQVHDDTARVWFSAQHGDTREALQAAIPKLRELFTEQGLQLVRADVTSGQERQPGEKETSHWPEPTSVSATDRPTGVEDLSGPSHARISDRLLDVYV